MHQTISLSGAPFEFDLAHFNLAKRSTTQFCSASIDNILSSGFIQNA